MRQSFCSKSTIGCARVIMRLRGESGNLIRTQLAEAISVWSVSTIKRMIRLLEEQGLLLSENWNMLKMDKTKSKGSPSGGF
jgi:Mn-dependent DtxR family transcriptional regulator